MPFYNKEKSSNFFIIPVYCQCSNILTIFHEYELIYTLEQGFNNFFLTLSMSLDFKNNKKAYIL